MSEPRPPAAAVLARWAPDPHRRTPPLRRLIAESLRLARRAGRRELAVLLAMQLVTMAGIVVTALVARSLLSGLLHADRTGGDAGGLVPEVLMLAGLSAALAVARAVQVHRQRILAELCSRYAEDRLLAVTGGVELAAFDDPDFHDAVERAVVAIRGLPAVITGLAGVVAGVAGTVGAIIALVALAPLFAPVVLFVLAPLWVAARRRGRVFTDSSATSRRRTASAVTSACSSPVAGARRRCAPSASPPSCANASAVSGISASRSFGRWPTASWRSP